MTPHISGSSLSAQARYAAGTREIVESYFAGTPIRDEYLIAEGGELAGTGARSYTPTKGQPVVLTSDPSEVACRSLRPHHSGERVTLRSPLHRRRRRASPASSRRTAAPPDGVRGEEV